MSALHEPAGITRKESASMNFLTAHRAARCDSLIASAVLSALIAGWVMSFITPKQLSLGFGGLLAYRSLDFISVNAEGHEQMGSRLRRLPLLHWSDGSSNASGLWGRPAEKKSDPGRLSTVNAATDSRAVKLMVRRVVQRV